MLNLSLTNPPGMMMEIQIPKQTSTPQRYFIKHNWPKQAGGVFGLISHDKTNPMSLIDPYWSLLPILPLQEVADSTLGTSDIRHPETCWKMMKDLDHPRWSKVQASCDMNCKEPPSSPQGDDPQLASTSTSLRIASFPQNPSAQCAPCWWKRINRESHRSKKMH